MSNYLNDNPNKPDCTDVIPMPFATKLLNLAAVAVPFLGFAGAVMLLWGRGVDWLHLSILLVMVLLTSLGVTIGYHRLFTHRAFETIAPVKFILSVLGSMAMEGPLLKWCATHRHHHQHSDKADDVHTPYHHGTGFRGFIAGFWHSHVGWVFSPEVPNLSRYVRDLLADRMVRFISDSFALWGALGLLLPALVAGLLTMSWTGALLGLLWGGLARIFIVHHLTWSINSVCHIWGSRGYRTHDESRNNMIMGVIGLGEGWHNNHHAFPTSARHGLAWWQIDISWWIIRLMELTGMAWNVRVPAAAQLASKRRATV